MSKNIHPTAMIDPKAKLGKNVKVGAYATIGPNVKIGDSTNIQSFAQIIGHTTVGKECDVFSYAVVGSIPQDLKYKGDKTYLKIGDNNIIREFVTINPGTEEDTDTVIGSGNLIMAYSHIAHDCRLGDNNILANCATLAGHVEVESRAVIGGMVAIHQFCRVGSYSIIGGCSKVVQDIPPFSMCDGHPAIVCGMNLVGLRRGKFTRSKILALKKAFKILFFDNHPFDKATILVKNEFPKNKEIDSLIRFISSSKRGIGR